MPPIYQPEVGADAVHWMAHHPRRELWVGRSTVKAIVGNRLVPWYGDRILADEGYSGQTTGEPRESSRSNLWEPVSGDRGAHGRFDDRSLDRSWQLEAAKHRNALLLAGAAAGVVGGVILWRGMHSRGAK